MQVEKQDNPLYIWSQNEDGLWCPACGDMIASRWKCEEPDYEAPDSCRTCGFPDFENGHGYFT